MTYITPEEIDECLPQTQCGLCGYGSCMPYAEALAFENAPIHLCPPGGVDTLLKLGKLLKQDAAPYLLEMEKKFKAKTSAKIREEECIGCTKCIQVCPVDAILGSAKQMHTVITNECTGCELCIPACPVDCIDLLTVSPPPAAEAEKSKNQARNRFIARESRLAKEKLAQKKDFKEHSENEKKKYIEAALARVSDKRKHSRE